MKKTLSLFLTVLIIATSIFVFVPSVEAEAAHSVVMTADEFIGYWYSYNENEKTNSEE